MKKVLFLDRDGVINVDHGYIYQPQQFEFIDGVFTACQRFLNAGFEIVVITNQSGIARGYYTEQDFSHLTQWMIDQFEQHGISILDVFFCPHHPTKGIAPYLGECECRKPKPGMLMQAIEKYGVDPKSSIIVGDKISDIEAGFNANIGQKYLVKTGQSFELEQAKMADGIFESLSQLSQTLLSPSK